MLQRIRIRCEILKCHRIVIPEMLTATTTHHSPVSVVFYRLYERTHCHVLFHPQYTLFADPYWLSLTRVYTRQPA